MRLASTVVLLSLLTAATMAAAQTTPRATSPAGTTLSLSITDGKGAPVGGVTVTASGPVSREAEADTNGSLRLQGLRPGTYRFRFAHSRFITLERDVVIPARMPTLDQSVMLSPAPAANTAPPPPKIVETIKPAPLPPPGKPLTVSVPDYVEKNFISPNAPQKVDAMGCSGLLGTSLWQIREPWENRQHPASDGMLYVIGGEGTLRLDGRDIVVQAGSYASIPRGTSYGLSRRGRNPLILLATLAGEPCSP
jgi:mannose-6-phosphate isomerase-like protein (cupin superfamily)